MGANESVPVNAAVGGGGNGDTCECGIPIADGGCRPAPSLMSSLKGTIATTRTTAEKDGSDPFNAKLLGTVKHYHRHIILCDGMMDWEPKIHKADGSFAQFLMKEVGRRENDLLPPSAQELADKEAKNEKKDLKKAGGSDSEPSSSSSSSGGGDSDKTDRDSSKKGGTANSSGSTPTVTVPGGGEQQSGATDAGAAAVTATTATAAAAKQSVPLVTACSEKSRGKDGMDILVYPENVRYVGVTVGDIPLFVEWQVVQGRVCPSLKTEPIDTKHLVLVCTHDSRDRRCGRIGPQVMKKLQDILEERDIKEDVVAVRGSSHLGGHKYAGVIVVYPHGDWYGYMTERNAGQLVDSYLSSNAAGMSQYWRGSMS